MIVWLAIAIGVLFASGTYLILRRSAVRMIFGMVLITHGANLLVFASGGLVRGNPPLLDPDSRGTGAAVADPLPQALVLTAIVIGFGLLVFAAALIERVRRTFETDDPDALREEVE